jgi:nucleotide-binding universal stress UspA family protein
MKIMVGFDGSATTTAALQLAESHARVFGAEILLVASREGGYDVSRDEFENTEKSITYEAERLKKAGLSCKSFVSVRGLKPGEDLVRLAEEKRVDEIIITVKKRSKVGKMLFGSTAQYVILHAPCPVVCVK